MQTRGVPERLGREEGWGWGERSDFIEGLIQAESVPLRDRVVAVNRVAKVVQGGRNFNFTALVVVGDGNGSVGIAVGKAREVSDAVTKATEAAKLNMRSYPLIRGTIPHPIFAKFKSAKVILKPATPGTGIIAGGSARAVLECWGATDVLCKSLGSSNPINVAYAMIKALSMLEDAKMVAQRRGLPLRRLLNLPSRG